MSGRGERRRDALVDAAAGLLGQQGPAALSARAVASRAGVPLAAVTYYFATVDALVQAAAERLYEGYLAEAVELARRAGDGRAEDRDRAALLVRLWLDPLEGGPDPGRVRSLLASVAAAAGSPALAPRLRRYDQDLTGLVAAVLRAGGRRPERARVLLAALDGFALARLCGVPLPEPSTAPGPSGDLDAARLLRGLTDDLMGVWDDLAPAQNSRAVGSSRPDSAT